jgi:hypothetical protein
MYRGFYRGFGGVTKMEMIKKRNKKVNERVKMTVNE